MFKNYLKTSLRFFAKHKGFSLLNILGLSIGTLCCIYILLYVRDQYSYDRCFSNSDDIYRVVTVGKSGASTFTRATTPPPLGPAIASDLPELLASTRVVPTLGATEHLLNYKGIAFYAKDAYLVDSNFFDLFDFHFTAGNAADALKQPKSIVLSRSVAEELFGIDDPIGKTIGLWDSYGDAVLTVTGVVDDSRGKSSIHANMFIRLTMNGMGTGYLHDKHWTDHFFTYTFIKLRPGIPVSNVQNRLPAFLARHLDGQNGGSTAISELHLQSISDIHTTGGYESEIGRTVSGFFLAILIGIAIGIQLLACINFMNLSTARASKRAKEVGVRKIVGAGNKGLILQFLVESFLLSWVAVLITMPLLISLLPWLNQVTGANIERAVFFDPVVWALLAVIAIVTGLLAGSYPAFYLAAFQAPKVLKGDLTSHISVAGLRRALVVFQFVLSIVLIVSIIVIRQQLDYIQKKDLGFTKDEQIVLNFHTWTTRRSAGYFADAMRQFPEVKDATKADNYPGSQQYEDGRFYLEGPKPGADIDLQFLCCDQHFLKTMGIRLVSGRDLHYADTGFVVINQVLALRLDLDSASAPGSRLRGEDGREYIVAGVMQDFNYQSLHEKVAPFMIKYQDGINTFNHLIIRVNSSHYSSLIDGMAIFWRRRIWMAPFSYTFLSDNVQRLYETEVIMATLIDSFTVMAIIISLLGLFGLAAFNAEQRTKEIGIRKVMGASIPGIVRLLSIDFLKLICLSFVQAVPIGYWVMHKWLNVFAYHIGISWWTFGVAGGSTIVIAMVVVCFQATKAAVVNPAKSLRTE
jgi:putative ABC transport system permease protein